MSLSVSDLQELEATEVSLAACPILGTCCSQSTFITCFSCTFTS